jgi:hypothetical protein
MSKTNLHETRLLELVFQNKAHANIGDTAGLQPSATAGNLYVALYTSDPGEDDTGSEANFTGYSRVGVVRSASGFTVSTGTVTNAANVTFPQSSGGTNTITHFGYLTASSGGDLLRSGAVTPNVTINSGDTAKFDIGQLTSTED